jgi:hypothetical protein
MNYLISKDYSPETPYYFYKTTNLINGKFYYGSGSDENYLGSGSRFQTALLKYGKEYFTHERLRYFETREEAFLFEDKFLKLYKISSLNESYNLKDEAIGGNNWNLLTQLEKEEYLNKRFVHHGKTLEEAYGTKKADTIKQKISKGKKPTKGKTIEEVYGKERADEIKLKIKNRKFEPSTIEKMSISAKKRCRLQKESKIKEYLLYLDNINIENIVLDSDIYNLIHKIRLFFSITSFKNMYPFIENKLKELEFQKRSNSKLGRFKHSKETKKKISDNKKGKSNGPNIYKGKSMEDIHGEEKANKIKEKISKSQTGKQHTEESKKKMSESQKGKTHTKYTKENISKLLTNTIIIIDGIEYLGYKEAVNSTGLKREKIKYRVYSKNFPNYQYIKLSNKYR